MTPKELIGRIEKLFDEANIFDGEKRPATADEERDLLRPLVAELIIEVENKHWERKSKL